MKILYNQEEIDVIIDEIADKINDKFKGEEVVFVGVLTGAVHFCSALALKVKCPSVLSFIKAKSYIGEKSQGKVNFLLDISMDLTNKNVIIVEDIIDSGLTLQEIHKSMLKRNLKSLTTVALLDKKCKRQVPFNVDIAGREIEDLFVVGFGLDYDELYRNLPSIYYFE